MGNLFNLDSPLMGALNKSVDFILFNLLTLLCCVPVVTIGAAMTALYDVMGRMQREEGGLLLAYFRAFKSNFVQASMIWLNFLAVGLLLLFGLFFYSMMEGIGVVLMPLSIMLLCLWAMALAWAWPLQSRFDNPVMRTVRNSLMCAVAYLPRSVVMAVLNLLPVLLFLFLPVLFLQLCVVWVLVWFSLSAHLNLKLLRKPFSALENGQTPAEEEVQ